MLLALTLPALAAPTTDALWRRFEAHFGDNPVADDAHGPGCLTGLVAELRAALPSLDASQQQQVLAAIEPWRQHLDPTAPPASCIGRYGSSYLEGDHFSVEWDNNAISESTAQDLLDALEYSWDVEMNDLGWYAPSGASLYPILVYVQSSSSAGAYTSVTECSEGSYSAMPYIVAYSGSFFDNSWYKTMAAHELNHTSQFYYGYAHEFYFWEATATWMAENVYPDTNDWYPYVYYGYSEQPHMAMNASDQSDYDVFYHMYGMAIWCFFLDQHVGGHELVQGLWELAWDYPYPGNLYDLWMPDAIAAMGYDFSAVYAQFMATSAVADFDDPDWYALPQTHDTVSSLPSSGSELPSTAPQSLGQNFIKFVRNIGEPGMALEVTFDGEDGVDWFAVLASGTDHSLGEYTVATLDSSGAGTVQIPFEGSEDVYLIVSPMDPAAVGMHYDWSNPEDFGYTWSAALVEDTSTPGDTGTPSDTGTPGDTGTPSSGDDTSTPSGDDTGDAPEESSACGCAASPGALPVGWLLALVAIGRRRR